MRAVQVVASKLQEKIPVRHSLKPPGSSFMELHVGPTVPEIFNISLQSKTRQVISNLVTFYTCKNKMVFLLVTLFW